MARILAGMSGGVDSSVAAALLKEEGHEVVGAYMKNWINEDNILGNCPWMQDIDDARAVCDQLGIEFRVVNLMDEYKDRVVSYLLEGYENGITPNPDVMCNREMKFGVFLDYALEEGFEKVATGHYAQWRRNDDGTCEVLKGADGNKDQTYFLALMRQQQVQHACFPIGHLPKPEVRVLAEKYGLVNATKKDSQGICFIGEIKMSDFLRTYVPDNPGNIVNLEGNVLGEHQGLHLYTLGQRKGLGVPSNAYKKAYVVVEKRRESNELVVAFEEADTPRLWATRCRVGSISYTNRELSGVQEIEAQPRYRSPSIPITMKLDATGKQGEVLFHERQRALTPGQICAFFDGDVLLGGGIFEEIVYEN